MLLPAFRAANPGEASRKRSAGQEVFDRANGHRAQRSRSRLEALFVSPDVTVKVSLKQLIESRSFGMPGTVLRRRFRNSAAVGILIRAIIGIGCERAEDNRLRPEEHVRQQTSCGFMAAIDLIAGETFEPMIYQPSHACHAWAEPLRKSRAIGVPVGQK